MASGNDMKAAESTYAGFTSLVKWGVVVCGVLTAIVVALIA